ncbi:hypothetical protein CLOM_g9961 [Closterium sp. NIES-68]|nr:hypothetical protein CLOM_g9961 [Closterium sp. NIES-68]
MKKNFRRRAHKDFRSTRHTLRQGVVQLQSMETNVILQLNKVLIVDNLGYNLLSTRDQAFDAFTTWLPIAERESGTKLKSFQSDGALEYQS